MPPKAPFPECVYIASLANPLPCAQDVESVLEASKEVRHGPKLKKVMEVILLMGNYMNSSNKTAGPVHGFKVDFLAKVCTCGSTAEHGDAFSLICP